MRWPLGFRGRSHLVAIFVGDMRNAYDTEVVTRLVGALNAIQKWPILIDGGGLSSVKEAMGEVLRYPLDALILRSGSMDPAIARECTKLHIPVISSGRVLNHPQIDNVCCRNQEEARPLPSSCWTVAVRGLAISRGLRAIALQARAKTV